MFKNFSLIRYDREFLASVEVMNGAYRSPVPLPMVVGGLAGGATYAYLAEATREAVRTVRESGVCSPVLILVPTDEARARVFDELSAASISVRAMKLREPVFYNISASHDVDRERLSVLSDILSGKCDAVVATPAAALAYTMPPEVLEASSLSLAVGDEISPDALSKKLSAMGFRSVDAVEDRGQLSRRGGIVDFWGESSDMPIRVEFFGDEIDRIAYFDPISQRAVGMADSIKLLPALEVIPDKAARERMLSTTDKLLSEAGDAAVKEKLERERGVILSGGTVDFRDRHLGLIYMHGYLPSLFPTQKPDC